MAIDYAAQSDKGAPMSLTAFIARIGTNIQFVAAMAHIGMTFTLLHFAGYFLPLWPMVAVVMVAAAIKEFIFDILYEHDPPQTFALSAQDFMGYLIGCGLATI
jgi:hypothetical protein